MKSLFQQISSWPFPLIMVMLVCISMECTPMPNFQQRDLMLKQELSWQVGGRVELTQAEQQLDSRLHRLKVKEMAVSPFPPSINFFKVRHIIQKSPIFKLLQKMPKGAALHIHSSAMVGVDWLVLNASYRPHCYICFTSKGSVRFLFSAHMPSQSWECTSWSRLDMLRASLSDVTAFDNGLMQKLTLFTEDPETAYPTQDAAWEKFEDIFQAISGLIKYAPVFKDYIYQGLKELYEDNIMYLELRVGLSTAYELDGAVHDRAWSLEVYRDITKQFKASHPDFIGTRIILSVHRSVSKTDMKKNVKAAIEMQKQYPDIIAGFDLVGHEDTGKSIWNYREALLVPPEINRKLPYFFHAGETDLHGTEVDRNVLDALLFNTNRIGHGFALVHHPLAKKLSRERRVAVELCPISNQVLNLVSDLRNHPARVLMSEGHPLVVSSDDPTLFGTTGLSYDFYEVFVGIGGLSANLGTLKELAMNSIRYSSLLKKQKDEATMVWQKKWDRFIAENKKL